MICQCLLAIAWGIAALLLAAVLSFEAITIRSLIQYTLILWILVFFIGLLAVRTIQNRKTWYSKKLVKHIVLCLFLFIAAGIAFLAVSLEGVGTHLGIPHLRTNVFTGECSLKTRGLDGSDPWYYRKGCDMPKDEKIDLISRNLDSEYTSIRGWCESRDRHGFDELLVWDEVTCEDLPL